MKRGHAVKATVQSERGKRGQKGKKYSERGKTGSYCRVKLDGGEKVHGEESTKFSWGDWARGKFQQAD